MKKGKFCNKKTISNIHPKQLLRMIGNRNKIVVRIYNEPVVDKESRDKK